MRYEPKPKYQTQVATITATSLYLFAWEPGNKITASANIHTRLCTHTHTHTNPDIYVPYMIIWNWFGTTHMVRTDLSHAMCLLSVSHFDYIGHLIGCSICLSMAFYRIIMIIAIKGLGGKLDIFTIDTHKFTSSQGRFKREDEHRRSGRVIKLCKTNINGIVSDMWISNWN